jgi:hypothetical protein
VGVNEIALIFPTFKAKNNMANMPMATKIPTQISIALFLIRTSVYSALNEDRSSHSFFYSNSVIGKHHGG